MMGCWISIMFASSFHESQDLQKKDGYTLNKIIMEVWGKL